MIVRGGAPPTPATPAAQRPRRWSPRPRTSIPSRFQPSSRALASRAFTRLRSWRFSSSSRLFESSSSQPGTGASGAPMTVAILLVIAAALALVFILSITPSRSLQISAAKGLATQIRPIDIEAFRNLAIPRKTNASAPTPARCRVPPVRRERLRAMAAYVQTAGRNAAVLVSMGQAACTGDAQTAEAARRLVDNALLLRRNAAFALLRIEHRPGSLAELRPGGRARP